MLKMTAILIGFFMQTFAATAFAQGGVDGLVGQWIVTWDANSKNTNTMSLTKKDERFSGTYENDKKDSCSVIGTFKSSNRKVNFQVVCPKWDIRMRGIASKNGTIIRGTYQAYTNTAGKFTMMKQ